MSINAWGSDDPAEVAKGGTGLATLTDHGILLGSGTAAVTPTAAPTDGQLLIGATGADPQLAVPTGDTDEIAIGTSSGGLSVGIADDPVLPGAGAVTVPDGATGSRPGTPADGMLRYNTTTNKFEGYENSNWVNLVTGGQGAWEVLTTVTISSDATITFDNTYITDDFDTYVFQFENIVVQTDNQALTAELSTNNGSSWITSGYDAMDTVVRSALGNATTTANFRVAHQIGNAAGEGLWGWFILVEPTNSGTQTRSWGNGGFINLNNAPYYYLSAGQYDTAADTDAIRFLMTSGNLNSGTIKLYGIRDS